MGLAYTERQADELMELGALKVEGKLTWGVHGQNLRASAAVAGAPGGGDLRLHMRVSPKVPGKYTVLLRAADGQVLRRLDVRGSHSNRGRRDSEERWVRRTHKHRHTDDFGDAVAYTPVDLPETDGEPWEPVTEAEYRNVFEGFCAECGVDPGESWTEPEIGGSGMQSAMEGV
jgi:hypothetical protein